MITIANLDYVGLNISLSFPQKSPQIELDKRTFDSIPENVGRTTRDMSARNNILCQNHATFWEDTEETYEQTRFVIHRKLLRRRHVRKEQKRLRMKQRAPKLEAEMDGIGERRHRRIHNGAVPKEKKIVNGGQDVLTHLKLGQICEQSLTTTDNGFCTTSNEVNCINNLNSAPAFTDTGYQHCRKHDDRCSLSNLTVTSNVSPVQPNKRRKFA